MEDNYEEQRSIILNYWKDIRREEVTYSYPYSLTSMLRMHSYAKFAIEMAAEEAKNSELEPILVIDALIDKFDEYSCYDVEGAYSYSVARDTLLDLYDHLLCIN